MRDLGETSQSKREAARSIARRLADQHESLIGLAERVLEHILLFGGKLRKLTQSDVAKLLKSNRWKVDRAIDKLDELELLKKKPDHERRYLDVEPAVQSEFDKELESLRRRATSPPPIPQSRPAGNPSTPPLSLTLDDVKVAVRQELTPLTRGRTTALLLQIGGTGLVVVLLLFMSNSSVVGSGALGSVGRVPEVGATLGALVFLALSGSLLALRVGLRQREGLLLVFGSALGAGVSGVVLGGLMWAYQNASGLGLGYATTGWFVWHSRPAVYALFASLILFRLGQFKRLVWSVVLPLAIFPISFGTAVVSDNLIPLPAESSAFAWARHYVLGWSLAGLLLAVAVLLASALLFPHRIRSVATKVGLAAITTKLPDSNGRSSKEGRPPA